MSESSTDDVAAQLEDNHKYGDLMNLARSITEQFDGVDVDTDAPKKPELCESLAAFDPQGSREDGWTVEVDGEREDVELLAVQTPENNGSSSANAPKDKTVLYCLTRAETTEERIDDLQELLNGSQYELEANEAGDKFLIIIPASEQEDPREPDVTKNFTIGTELSDDGIDSMLTDEVEQMGADDYTITSRGDAGDDNEVILSVDFFGVDQDDDEEDDEEPEDNTEEDTEEDADEGGDDDASSEAESGAESEEGDEQSESSESDEDSESEASDAAEEDKDEEDEDEDEEDGEESDEDEDETVPEAAYRKSLDKKTKDEVYNLAIEYDVDDRSNMTKAELIDSLVEVNEQVE